MNKSFVASCAIPGILLSAALMAGCSFSYSSRSSSGSSSGDGDDSDTVVVQQAAPNYPQQLLQLNEAYEKKLISEQDYQKQLQAIQKAMNK